MSKSKIQNEIDHFSNLSHIWWGATTYAGQKRYDNKLKALKKYLPKSKQLNILEIGCGDGEFTKRLLKLNARIIATDATPAVIKRAKHNKLFSKGGVTFKVADCEKLPFRDNTFDVVCGVSILHHVDLVKSLKEAKRVLKPNGFIFFTEPNMLNPIAFIATRIPYLRNRLEYSPDETALIRWEISRAIKQLEFTAIKVNNFDFLHPSTPKFLVPIVDNIGQFAEKVLLLKEISGSLSIFAKKATDLNSNAMITIHRDIIKKNKLLNKTYKRFYQSILNKQIPKGKMVELGSGAGFMKQVNRNIITSDVVSSTGIDKVFYAEKMPFKTNSIAAFYMLNVFHHIKNIDKALTEMQRCLVPEGKIIMIEPYNTFWARFIYKNFHHEPFDEHAGWKVSGTGRLSDSNQALPWIVFKRDIEKFNVKYKKLKVLSIEAHTPLSYILSGGLSRPPIVSPGVYPYISFFEKLISPLNNYLGLFATITVEKK